MKPKSKTPSPTTSASPSTVANSGKSRSAAPTHDEISARARQIWERNGRPDGRDEEHWFQAERELRGGAREADERRFADPDRLVDAQGDPADEVDRTLDRLAAPRGQRSATSL